MGSLFSSHTKKLFFMLGSKSLGDAMPPPLDVASSRVHTPDTTVPSSVAPPIVLSSRNPPQTSASTSTSERRPSAASLATVITAPTIVGSMGNIPETTRRYALPIFSRFRASDGENVEYSGLASVGGTVEDETVMEGQEQASMMSKVVTQRQLRVSELLERVHAVNTRNHQLLCAHYRREPVDELADGNGIDTMSAEPELLPVVLGAASADTANLISLLQLMPHHFVLCASVLEDPLRDFFVFLVLHRVIGPISVDPSTASMFLKVACSFESKRWAESRDELERKYGVFFETTKEMSKWDTQSMPLLKGTSSLSAILGQYTRRFDVVLYFRDLWGKVLAPLLEVARNEAYNDRRNCDPIHVSKLRVGFVTQTLKVVRRLLDILLIDECIAAFPAPAAVVYQSLDKLCGFEASDLFLVDLLVLPNLWAFVEPYEPFARFTKPTYVEGDETWEAMRQHLNRRLKQPWVATPESNIGAVCIYLWVVFHSAAHELQGLAHSRKTPGEMGLDFVLMEPEIESRIRGLVDRYRSRIALFRKKINQLPAQSEANPPLLAITASLSPLAPATGGVTQESTVAPRALLKRRLEHLCPLPREMTNIIVTSRAELDSLLEALQSAHTYFLEHKQVYLNTIRDPLVTSLHNIIVTIDMGEHCLEEAYEVYRLYRVHQENTPVPGTKTGNDQDKGNRIPGVQGGSDDESVVTFPSLSPSIIDELEKLQFVLEQAMEAAARHHDELLELYVYSVHREGRRGERNSLYYNMNFSKPVGGPSRLVTMVADENCVWSSSADPDPSSKRSRAPLSPTGLNAYLSADGLGNYSSALSRIANTHTKSSQSRHESLSPGGTDQGTAHGFAYDYEQQFVSKLRAPTQHREVASSPREMGSAHFMAPTGSWIESQLQGSLHPEGQPVTEAHYSQQFAKQLRSTGRDAPTPSSRRRSRAAARMNQLVAEQNQELPAPVGEQKGTTFTTPCSIPDHVKSKNPKGATSIPVAIEKAPEALRSVLSGVPLEGKHTHRTSEAVEGIAEEVARRLDEAGITDETLPSHVSVTGIPLSQATCTVDAQAIDNGPANQTDQEFMLSLKALRQKLRTGSSTGTSAASSISSAGGRQKIEGLQMTKGYFFPENEARLRTTSIIRENAAATATESEETIKNHQSGGASQTKVDEAADAAAEGANTATAAAADGEQRWLTGFEVIKHGRRGKPKKRYLQMDKAQTMIQWSSHIKNGEQALIALSDVTEVRRGITTDVLQRTGNKRNSCRYFSIIARSRNLDIEVESEEIRDSLVVGLDKTLHEKDPHT